MPALRFEGPWKQGLPTFVSRQSRVCCLYHEKQQSKHSKGTGHMRRRRRNGQPPEKESGGRLLTSRNALWNASDTKRSLRPSATIPAGKPGEGP